MLSTESPRRDQYSSCSKCSLWLCRWVINNDYDEYFLFPKSPTMTLISFLSNMKNFDFVEFGNTIYTYATCEDVKRVGSTYEPWPVERMVYRQKGPYCKRHKHGLIFDPPLCGGARGRRKYAMNPSTMLGFMTPHRMLVMEGFNVGFYKGGNNTRMLITSSEDVVLAHYRHFISQPICSLAMENFLTTDGATYEYPDDSPFESSIWERDLGVHKTVVRFRRRNILLI